MQTSLFTNFTDQEFIGYWDGKAKKFTPGQSTWMPDYLAKHFAKHLTNKELVRTNKNGDLIYKNGDKFTSPKFPDQIPLYMELFNKAYQLDDTNKEEELGNINDDIDTLISSANKNKQEKKSSEPQVIVPPDFDEDNESEESFGGKPV